jgi:hypothetical protein
MQPRSMALCNGEFQSSSASLSYVHKPVISCAGFVGAIFKKNTSDIATKHRPVMADCQRWKVVARHAFLG